MPVTPTKSNSGPCPYAPTKPVADPFVTPVKPPKQEQQCPPGPKHKFKDHLIERQINFDEVDESEQSDYFNPPEKN